MLYEFKLGHNAVEAAKNICGAKNEGVVDHRTVTRWFKKICSGYKNFDNQARSGKHLTWMGQDVVTTHNTGVNFHGNSLNKKI